jgi:stage V sporulation protein AC
MKQPFDAKEYQKEVARRAPKSPALLQCAKAFLVGGLICVLGQGIHYLALLIPLNEQDASTVSSVSLIFLTALLTGLGVFDKIASFALSASSGLYIRVFSAILEEASLTAL